MFSNTRVTRSKGQPEAVSLPPRTRQGRKSTNTSDQHPTSLAHGLGQLQPDTPVQTSALLSQPPRPTPSQSIRGPTAGARPPSRASSVMDTTEDRAQPMPPGLMPAGCRKPQYLLHPARYLGHLRLEFNYPILNFLAHTYHNYLVLYLQKIDTAPAQEVTRNLVMQKLIILRIIKHHLKPASYLSYRVDLHQTLWITLPRVIPTKRHHRMNTFKKNSTEPIIISFQMALTTAYMTSRRKHSYLDT